MYKRQVSKYPTTQKMWTEVMENNPSKFKGDNKPVENITWWQALEYCNKLSEKYGLEPVYDLSKSAQGILMIKELGGETVYPDVANFKNTEGFRLPTEVEWEWFARGGQIAIEQDGKRSGKLCQHGCKPDQCKYDQSYIPYCRCIKSSLFKSS